MLTYEKCQELVAEFFATTNWIQPFNTEHAKENLHRCVSKYVGVEPAVEQPEPQPIAPAIDTDDAAPTPISIREIENPTNILSWGRGQTVPVGWEEFDPELEDDEDNG